MVPSGDDIKILEDSLAFIWSNKLDKVFQDRKLLAKILCLMFDRNFLYIFTKLPIELPVRLKENIRKRSIALGYNLYIVPHKVPLETEDLIGWQTGIKKIDFLKYMPKKFKTTSQLVWPRVSGPTPSLFLKIQLKIKKRWRPFNPYVTIESYLDTILHEFGHAYFGNQYKTWHGERSKNLKLIKTALKLFEGKNGNMTSVSISIPPNQILSEIFAFCCEYYAAERFWPKHKQNIDREMAQVLPSLIKRENTSNLNYISSVLDSYEVLHYNAAIFGKLILNKYGSNWPSYFS